MLAPGTHRLGPASGSLRVRTYRDGVAARVGHDLVLEVTAWEGTVAVAGTRTTIALTADPRSLVVREALHGVKPLSDRERAGIGRTIERKVLRGRPIAFRATVVRPGDGGRRLVVEGELELAGRTRPLTLALDVAPDGRVTGAVTLAQTEWGIEPYRGLLGALRLRDDVDVEIDVHVPVAA